MDDIIITNNDQLGIVSQPTLRREGDMWLAGASSKKEYARSRHQRLFEENVGKTRKRRGLRTLSVKGSRVVFTHGEGISTPRVRHKGWQPLIKCANMTSKMFYYPFLCLFALLCFLCFLYFFYLFVVDKGVSLTPTYPSIMVRKSDLRSSLRIKRWLSCFYPFLQDIFWLKGHLRRWTIKQSFGSFWKERKH